MINERFRTTAEVCAIRTGERPFCLLGKTEKVLKLLG